MRVVGLMSGTSYDGIDVAAAEFRQDGEVLVLETLGAASVPYPDRLRAGIAAVLPPARSTVGQLCRLDTELGQAYARAAQRGLELCDGPADLIVSPGQTVYHWVADGRALGTLQLGQPAWIAAATGLPVLSDLRSADIAQGGQGAPLVPAFDALLLPPAATPRAALNLGGIANLTVINPDGTVLGYDTGPANALIDAAATELLELPYDPGGRHAASGQVHAELLAELLDEPYYAAPAPKSTGKELFHAEYLWQRLAGRDLAVDDVLATVTELTARVVVAELARHRVTQVVVAGGGVRNPVLLGRIRTLAGTGCELRSIEESGVPADAKEAYAFALLGYLSWHGLPGAVPSATGARAAAVLGRFTPGAAPLRLPDPPAVAPARLRVAARARA